VRKRIPVGAGQRREIVHALAGMAIAPHRAMRRFALCSVLLSGCVDGEIAVERDPIDDVDPALRSFYDMTNSRFVAGNCP